MSNSGYLLLIFLGMSFTAVTALAQHKYYGRTVRRLAREHDEPGFVLVSGRGTGRLRGAIVILVLRTQDEVIRAATVMEGATVLARFKSRPDWVGLSARDPLPRCSTRVANAVADARSHVPGRGAPLRPRLRFTPPPRPATPPRPAAPARPAAPPDGSPCRPRPRPHPPASPARSCR